MALYNTRLNKLQNNLHITYREVTMYTKKINLIY